MMILTMFLLFGLIQHVSLISCYTCGQVGQSFCPIPFTIDAGEEHNENDVNSYLYGPDYVCLSDHSIDPKTGDEKLRLGGEKNCEEVNRINHRRYCCSTDNCNKELPKMLAEPIIFSRDQQYVPSIILISFAISFQYIY